MNEKLANSVKNYKRRINKKRKSSIYSYQVNGICFVFVTIIFAINNKFDILLLGVDPMESFEFVFESENIYFIKMSESLLEEYLKMYNDIKIQTLLFKKTFSQDQIANWINKQINDKNLHIYSMIEKTTNEYIGNFEIIIKDNNVCEILLSITPNKQNKHYGTESIKAMMRYATKEFDVEEFELYVKSTNLRAIHCYENIGFIKRGSGLTEDDIHMSCRK